MKAPTLHQQMFGDINRQLNTIRARINREIKAECLEIMERKKEDGKDAAVI